MNLQRCSGRIKIHAITHISIHLFSHCCHGIAHTVSGAIAKACQSEHAHDERIARIGNAAFKGCFKVYPQIPGVGNGDAIRAVDDDRALLAAIVAVGQRI